MCEKHSFLVDIKGNIFHGYGLLESHSQIAAVHGIDEDKCNKYEYNPKKPFWKEYGINGLDCDSKTFEPSKQIVDNIDKYLKEIFPTEKHYKYYIAFIGKSLPEPVCLEAVKQDGYALQYVKDQTEPVCLEAVKRNGDALRYVKDQTEPVCLEAVKQDGDALQYVKIITHVILDYILNNL